MSVSQLPTVWWRVTAAAVVPMTEYVSRWTNTEVAVKAMVESPSAVCPNSSQKASDPTPTQKVIGKEREGIHSGPRLRSRCLSIQARLGRN